MMNPEVRQWLDFAGMDPGVAARYPIEFWKIIMQVGSLC